MVCPFDQEVMELSEKRIYNKQLMKALQSVSVLMILCDEHPGRDVEFYCVREHQFVCNRCAILKHADHLGQLREVVR